MSVATLGRAGKGQGWVGGRTQDISAQPQHLCYQKGLSQMKSLQMLHLEQLWRAWSGNTRTSVMRATGTMEADCICECDRAGVSISSTPLFTSSLELSPGLFLALLSGQPRGPYLCHVLSPSHQNWPASDQIFSLENLLLERQ